MLGRRCTGTGSKWNLMDWQDENKHKLSMKLDTLLMTLNLYPILTNCNKKVNDAKVLKFNHILPPGSIYSPIYNRLQNKLISLLNGQWDMTCGQIKRLLKDNN